MSSYSVIRCLKHDIEYPRGMFCPKCLDTLMEKPVIEHKKSDSITKKEAEDLGRHGQPDPVVKTPAQIRKEHPMYSGLVKYFPRALRYVAHVSHVGNEQHNPGKPLHWSREKSSDHLDCAVRHIADYHIDPVDDDTILHLGKAAWRLLAQLELDLERTETVSATAKPFPK